VHNKVASIYGHVALMKGGDGHEDTGFGVISHVELVAARITRLSISITSMITPRKPSGPVSPALDHAAITAVLPTALMHAMEPRPSGPFSTLKENVPLAASRQMVRSWH
jgi:hypothetical protein